MLDYLTVLVYTKTIIHLSVGSQTTNIGPNISEKAPSDCGVPQGSVLGPLLFCCTKIISQTVQISSSFIYLLMTTVTCSVIKTLNP